MDSWQQVLSILEHKVNQQSYNTWFKPTQLIKHEGRALYVRVPNAFFQDWLNEHIDVVIEAARIAGIGEIDVVYITEKGVSPPTDSPVQRNLDFESIDNTLNPTILFAVNANRADLRLSPRLDWLVTGSVTMSVGFDIFQGHQQTLYGQFDHTDRVTFTTTWRF